MTVTPVAAGPSGTTVAPSLEQATDIISSPGPFEGPEKLLELWFAPSPDHLPAAQASTSAHTSNGTNGESSISGLRPRAPNASGKEWKGLRQVPREVWEEMLDIVKCKVLSMVEGDELDAYLLSESSLFVAPHSLILKTCGTTLNLLGLPRIIEIARQYCGYTNIWRCFYSRKSFFFPERQMGPHRDWGQEVKYLDSIFGAAGSAYTVGPMNRDHWLLYLTSPNTQPLLPSDSSLNSDFRLSVPAIPALASASSQDNVPMTPSVSGSGHSRPIYQDTTLEILMSHLEPAGREPFFQPEGSAPIGGHELGDKISAQLGIDKLFPGAKLDSFGFDPCGYSANAVVGTGGPGKGKEPEGGYFTIHVTPEDGWSYASFECNVGLPLTSTAERPDLPTLIQNVINIFQPNRLSITLFVSTPSSASSKATNVIPSRGPAGSRAVPAMSAVDPHAVTNEVETRAWKAFGADMLGGQYVRKDRIGYEFDGYDFVFACFDRRGWTEPRITPLPSPAT